MSKLKIEIDLEEIKKRRDLDYDNDSKGSSRRFQSWEDLDS